MNTQALLANFSWNSWSSILAGVVLILMIQFSLSLLGMGIGLITVNPKRDQYPLKALTAGASIWWVLTSLAAVYAGSWMASRLSNVSVEAGRLYGVITWALTMLIALVVFARGAGMAATGAMGMVSGGLRALGAIGGAVGVGGGLAAGAAIKSGVVGEAFPQLSGQLQTFNNRIKKFMNNQEAKEEIAHTAGDIIRKGPSNINQADKEKFEHVITKYTDISEKEAKDKVDQLISQATAVTEQVEERTKEVAEETIKSISVAAFASFVMLVLTFFVAIMGGANGAMAIATATPAAATI
ncbi:MAG TPA: hypothetical protein PLU24_05150 [Candidatus Omnitrophota bacterium]|nr:hypothetical protein [Candidatus Omnitrophota bacterium]